MTIYDKLMTGADLVFYNAYVTERLNELSNDVANEYATKAALQSLSTTINASLGTKADASIVQSLSGQVSSITENYATKSGVSQTLQSYVTTAGLSNTLDNYETKIDAATHVVIQGNAGFHNSHFRGKDITSYFTDGSLYTRINNGTFEGLYVGDYFTASINGTNYTCRLAGFDIYWNSGDTALQRHHAVIIPDTYFMAIGMNASHTTEGAYYNSRMRQETIPTINGYLEATFGNHLLTVRELLSNAMNAETPSGGYSAWMGASSSWGWYDSKAELMSEIEVYGSTVWSSSGYDTGIGRSQMPLFALAPQFINPGRFVWWLRGVASTTYFCYVSSYGYADYANAGNALGVRPRWLIG